MISVMKTNRKDPLVLLQIERPLIAYSLCFEDEMKTCLEHDGIPHEYAFGYCRPMAYDNTKDWGDRLSFQECGNGKFQEIGIEIQKTEIEDLNSAIFKMEEELENGWVFLHYDGYFCPWDVMQKLRKRHTAHSVIVTEIDSAKKCVTVADPFYLQNNRKISFSALKEACGFYFVVKTDKYIKKTAEQIHESQSGVKNNASPIMERFIADLTREVKSGVCTDLFSASWIREIERLFMSRHYLWLFYRKLYQESRNARYGAMAITYFSALSDWKECVVCSHKGARRPDKLPLFDRFTECFRRGIDAEKRAEGFIAGKAANDIILLSSSREALGEPFSWDIRRYFNCRACKLRRKDTSSADITGEGEYILPAKHKRNKITVLSACYRVYLGDSKDHIRCEGQLLELPNGKWRGVSLLLCSEWGRSQVLLQIQGEKRRYLTDYLANDFSFIGQDSVRVGRSYLIGKKKDIRFQKNVYLQSVTFKLPEKDTIKNITLPTCFSLHLFGAVLWESLVSKKN